MAKSEPAGGLEAVRLPRRRWWTRISGAQIVMVIAGILAFLVNLTVLRARDDFVLVAVASDDVNSGVVFDVDRHVDLVELPADSVLASSAIGRDQLAAYDGMVLTASLRQGDLINASQLRDPAASADLRAMSLAVDTSRAAGGRIGVGDRVDVIAVADGVARYVLTGAEVIDRSEQGSSGSITGSRAFFVVVAVTADQALELAAAIEAADIQIVRSTGASPPARLELIPAETSESEGNQR